MVFLSGLLRQVLLYTTSTHFTWWNKKSYKWQLFEYPLYSRPSKTKPTCEQRSPTGTKYSGGYYSEVIIYINWPLGIQAIGLCSQVGLNLKAGDKISTRPLVIMSEIWKRRVILPKHSAYRTSALGKITRGSRITYYSLMFFIAYTFKGQVHVFAGWVKIVSHSSCRTSTILKYRCPLGDDP